MTQKELLKPFIKESDWQDIIKAISEGRIMDAVRIIRINTGDDLNRSAKCIRKIAKEELGLNILEFCERY